MNFVNYVVREKDTVTAYVRKIDIIIIVLACKTSYILVFQSSIKLVVELLLFCD
ncbi:hypothetical protein Fmac_008455 [Flemingia macrophylla]|uniref:Uncharacterized protein n=1 Tax=Flemingia macrophylla TaxID=520843 RepID=A0ABD1MXF3_9FABA